MSISVKQPNQKKKKNLINSDLREKKNPPAHFFITSTKFIKSKNPFKCYNIHLLDILALVIILHLPLVQLHADLTFLYCHHIKNLVCVLLVQAFVSAGNPHSESHRSLDGGRMKACCQTSVLSQQ